MNRDEVELKVADLFLKMADKSPVPNMVTEVASFAINHAADIERDTVKRVAEKLSTIPHENPCQVDCAICAYIEQLKGHLEVKT